MGCSDWGREVGLTLGKVIGWNEPAAKLVKPLVGVALFQSCKTNSFSKPAKQLLSNVLQTVQWSLYLSRTGATRKNMNSFHVNILKLWIRYGATISWSLTLNAFHEIETLNLFLILYKNETSELGRWSKINFGQSVPDFWKFTS